MLERLAAVTILAATVTTVSTAAADDESDRIKNGWLGFVGLGVAQQTSELETPELRMKFTDTFLSFEAYIIAGRVYGRFSHSFYGVAGTSSVVTPEGKMGTGQFSEAEASYNNDHFLLLLPKMEVGIVLLPHKPIRPTLGLYFSDSASTYASTKVYYSVDVGVSAGLALRVGGPKTAFLIHPTFHAFKAIHGNSNGFEPGTGAGVDVVVALMIARKVALFSRVGYEAHNLSTSDGWFGTDAADSTPLSNDVIYMRFGLGYVPPVK